MKKIIFLIFIFIVVGLVFGIEGVYVHDREGKRINPGADRPQNNWPISHLNAGSAASTQLLAAPTINESHYITGFLLSGGLTGDGFNLLRRSCIQLDASAENITISDNAALEPGTGDFSIEFWAKIDTDDVTLGDIIHKDDGSDQGYFGEITSAGVFKFTMGDGTHTASITGSTAINDNSWHYIVVTCDISETDGLNLYIDGSSDATAVDPTSVSGCTGGATDFTINGVDSKLWYCSTYAFWKAAAHPAASVLDRYNSGVGQKFTGSETNISVAINIDEGVGSTCYDKVASNNGTINNATWASDGIPIDPHTLSVIDIIHCAKEVQVSAVGSYTIPNTVVKFPHAIKIGRGNPVSILETDGAFTLILFGFTDTY